MRTVLVFVVLTALFGALFIGRGLTGLVTSETCCFGSSCSAEYACTEFRSQPQASALFVQFGVLFGAVAFAAFLAHNTMKN